MKENFHKLVYKLFPNFKESFEPLKNDLSIQTDTDSLYICLEEIINKLNIKFNNNQEVFDWMNNFDKTFITPFFDKILQIYADKYETEQLINFKREKIIIQKIITAKKKYVDEIIANEDKLYIDKPKVSITGIEIVRTDTPKFCRTKIEEVVNEMLATKCADREKIIQLIKNIKEQFIKSSINDISINKAVKEYQKYAQPVEKYLKNGLYYPDHCPMHVRAAINYNCLVAKYKLPFIPINNGTKTKFVHVLQNNEINQDVIGFVSNWPDFLNEKFKINYELQFEKTFIAVIQRFFEVLNWGNIELEGNNLSDLIEF